MGRANPGGEPEANMIVFDQSRFSETAVPSSIPQPNPLPPTTRRALRAVDAVARGELDVHQASRDHRVDAALLEIWIRALGARRSARPADRDVQ